MDADFPVSGAVERSAEGDLAGARATVAHSYESPGTYFASVRVKANRAGDPDDLFTQVKNIARARVIVEARVPARDAWPPPAEAGGHAGSGKTNKGDGCQAHLSPLLYISLFALYLRIQPVAPRRLTRSQPPSSFRMGRVVFASSRATLGADVSSQA